MREHPAADRNRVDRRLIAAHEFVLERWSDDRVEELSPIVRTEPMYQPLNPSEYEAAFYVAREWAKQEIEMEAVTENHGGAEVVVDYAPKSE